MVLEYSYCALKARKRDWDRFICTLFAPQDLREDLFAILAFNAEIARTREVVSEPMLGEIRLQWWRDALAKIYGQDDIGSNVDLKGHEVLNALGTVISDYDLPKRYFDTLIDVRAQDMTDNLPENVPALRAYAHGSSVMLNELILEILCWQRSGEADLFRECIQEAGLAWALTGLVRATGSLSRCGSIMIPQSVLDECGVEKDDVLARRITPEISQAIREVCHFSWGHIDKARKSAPRKIKRCRSLLLPVTLAESFLRRIEKAGFNPFDETIEKGRTGRQVKLAVKALRGGF